FDHGFLFGDSIYEAFRTYNGRLFLFSRHFERLEHSARGVFMTIPWSREKTRAEIIRTIGALHHAGESRIRLIVTRGIGGVTADPDSCTTPNVIILASPIAEMPAAMYSDG